MVAITSLVLGAAALLGGGWFATSLVASLAEPVSLILGAVTGAGIVINLLRMGLLEGYFSSEEAELLAAGLIGATGFYLTFVVTQALITALSPLAGIIVVALGVFVFVVPGGPKILFEFGNVVYNQLK